MVPADRFRWDEDPDSPAPVRDVTPAIVRDFLRLDPGDPDGELERMIGSAYRDFERGAAWWVEGRRVRITVDGGFPNPLSNPPGIKLSCGHVRAIRSATLFDEDDWTERLLDGADWRSHYRGRILRLRFEGDTNRVSIMNKDLELSADVGYAAGRTPEDIEQAVLQIAGTYYRFREHATLTPVSVLPLGARQTMRRYRRDRLGPPLV